MTENVKRNHTRISELHKNVCLERKLDFGNVLMGGVCVCKYITGNLRTQVSSLGTLAV